MTPDALAKLDYSKIDRLVANEDFIGLEDLTKSIILATVHKRLALMKALYGMKLLYDKLGLGLEESFVEYAVGELGIKPDTVNKYISAWERIMLHPHVKNSESLQEGLQTLGVKSLIWLAPKVEELIEKPDDWKPIVAAGTYPAIQAYVRREMGVGRTSSKNRVTVTINSFGEEEGWIYARRGEEEKQYVGYLPFNRMEEDSAVGVALRRIINNSGIYIK